MTQPQNAGAQPDGSPYESDEQPSKRKLVIAAAAAFVLLAGGGGYLLLGGGGDAGPDTSLAVPKKVGAKTSPVPTPAAVPVALPPAAVVKVGVNPFKPYVLPPPPSAAAAAAGGATTAVAGSTPGTSTSTGTSTTSPSGGTGTAVVAPASGAEYKLTLVKIEKGAEGTKELTWSVDGVTKQTIGGMRFGKYGELIQLGVSGDSTFATIQVGDAMPINVKVGETVNVL